MELQWNYNETFTGATAAVKTMDMHIELKETVTKLFNDSQDYHDLDLVSKYQQVFETVTFMFEDYRKDFEKIITKRLGDMTQEQLQVEAIVFCSWASIEVMTALSNQYIKT